MAYEVTIKLTCEGEGCDKQIIGMATHKNMGTAFKRAKVQITGVFDRYINPHYPYCEECLKKGK